MLQKRQGVNFRVNLKERGDCFGEVSLMYSCPRTATVAATTDAVVWVLDRDVCRYVIRSEALCNTLYIAAVHGMGSDLNADNHVVWLLEILSIHNTMCT